jgi:hypothetical protein
MAIMKFQQFYVASSGATASTAAVLLVTLASAQ